MNKWNFGEYAPSDSDIKELGVALVHWLEEEEKRKLKTLRHHHIDEFLLHINKALKNEYKRLNGKGYDELAVKELIIETNKLSDELSILALFKTLEIQGIRFIKELMPNLSRFQLTEKRKKTGKEQKYTLSEILEKDLFEIDEEIKSINGYDSFNELRFLNNSIKHQGVVNADLADFYKNNERFDNKGKEIKREKDENLEDLDDDYCRLKPEIILFLSELFEKVDKMKTMNFCN